MPLSKSLRALTQARDELNASLTSQIRHLASSCSHEESVILEPAPFERLCIICGLLESGPEFPLMKKPLARFDFSGPRFAERLNLTPLGDRLMKVPIEEVREWVSKNGSL